MVTRPVSDEALNSWMQRILPQHNPDRQDRIRAWSEWQERYGEQALAGFVRARNSTRETDEDIVQESLFTAYLGVESGRYQPREGVPFIAYVIGIARNKIREARRRERRLSDLDLDGDEPRLPKPASLQRQPERAIERREQVERLWSGIARLPAARRQVIERYLSGASTGEIAGSMAISEELVRQHKCRGLRALERELAPNMNRYPV